MFTIILVNLIDFYCPPDGELADGSSEMFINVFVDLKFLSHQIYFLAT